ncbi:hypothetical protein ALC56_01807 [Trachymyrmex septentrionalis]|uniref:Uncharacterized protein n=1 Tax=Trachymyrmex septentrionalis TaxID=34720 RepID=A0A195FSX6_9HYME|nr:hypothetical protein ALC56_01807 [Trachymyrmex septentrionalis]
METYIENNKNIKMLMDIEEEVMQNLKKIFDELTTRTSTIHKQIKSLYTRNNILEKKIEALESRNENHSSPNYLPESTIESSNESFDSKTSHCECTHAILNKKIQLLKLQLKSKNEIIAMLELQIYITHLFDEKFKNLNDRILIGHNIKVTR